MASTSASQPITIVSCEEEYIDFMFQSNIELGSQETSNVDIDVTWWPIEIYGFLPIKN
jgi:hypothetical protein